MSVACAVNSSGRFGRENGREAAVFLGADFLDTSKRPEGDTFWLKALAKF